MTNKERGQRWRAKNKERVKEYRKLYLIKNKDKFKEYYKKYREKSEVKQYQKEYYKNNKEIIANRSKVRAVECKEELKQYQREYYEKHADYITERKNNWIRNNKDRHMNNQLLWHSGIGLDDYNILFDKQSGCCAICGEHQSKFKRALSVDHDHATNKIRGLLCMNCNLMLGHSKDSIMRLKKAIIYLEEQK
jgi:hypothetical protein